MPRAEDLSRVPAINRVVIDLPRLDERGPIHPLAEARPHHAIAEALREAVGPNVHQLRHEVGIGSRRGGVKFYAHWAGHFQVSGQRLGLVNQHIIAPLDSGVIVWPADLRGGWLGDEGNGPRGVVAVAIGWRVLRRGRL